MRKLLSLLALLLLAGCSSSSNQQSSDKGCVEQDFSYSVGPSEGAAGTNYTPLIVKNVSDISCTLSGFPIGQPVVGSERAEAAPPSQPNGDSSKASSLTLKPGESGSLLFAVATASNYPAEECVPSSADGVKIILKNGSKDLSGYFALPGFEVCTKLVNTFVSPLVAGDQP